MRKEKPHASHGAWGRLLGTVAVIAAGCVDLGTPQWSPDGRKIVYTRVAADSPEVRLVDLDVARPPRLLAAGAYYPQWSPDGERVYFLQEDGLRSCRPDGTDVRLTATHIAQYELSPDGRKIYFVREGDEAAFGLVLARGQTERVTREGVKCAGMALGPDGELLAYAVRKEKRGRQGYEIRLLDLAEGGRGRVLEDFVPACGKGEGPLRMLFRRQPADLVAFQYEGAERVDVLPLAGGRSRAIKTPALRLVVMSAVSPEGAYLYLTEAGRDSASSRLVDLETGEAELLVGASPALVGGLGWAPGGGAVAEHSRGGLLVRDVHGAWERYYPVSAEEYAAAARTRIRQGKAELALDILDEAIELGEPGLDRQRVGLVAVDAHLHLGERGRAADRLLEAWLLHPVSEVDQAQTVRLFGALADDDRLADLIFRALREEPAGRVGTLEEAIALTGDARLIAGLRLRLGEAQLEAKNHREAGRQFRLASEVEDYPAADYAAALAGGAHFVAGNDSYAEELLLKAVDSFPDSVLAGDLRRALAFVREEKGEVLRRTAEAQHESGASAWVTVRSVRSMRWSFGRREAGGLFSLEADERSALWVASADGPSNRALSELPVSLGVLRFSPSGDRVAFLAGAEETGDWASLSVVDLRGNVILGDRRALSRPPPGPRSEGPRVVDHAWDRTGQWIVLTEETTDALGRRSRRQRRVRVPAAPL